MKWTREMETWKIWNDKAAPLLCSALQSCLISLSDIALLQTDITVDHDLFQVLKKKLIHLPIWLPLIHFKCILLIFLWLKTGFPNLWEKRREYSSDPLIKSVYTLSKFAVERTCHWVWGSTLSLQGVLVFCWIQFWILNSNLGKIATRLE